MDILSKILISFILILSVLKILTINNYIISLFMVVITALSIKYDNTNYSLLLTIILLLVISNNFLVNEQFTNNTQDNLASSSKYCIPAKNGTCPHPLNPSINDPNWCCVGDCYCNQPCPPTTCQKKTSWGNCPNKQQVTSIDNPDMCCYGEGCKCNTDTQCPKATTCGYTPPEEEEEEAIDPNICPCNTSLECTKKVKEIKRDYNKLYYKPRYSSPPPPICNKYINNNSTQNGINSDDSMANNTTYISQVKIPSNYTPTSDVMRTNPFNQYIN